MHWIPYKVCVEITCVCQILKCQATMQVVYVVPTSCFYVFKDLGWLLLLLELEQRRSNCDGSPSLFRWKTCQKRRFFLPKTLHLHSDGSKAPKKLTKKWLKFRSFLTRVTEFPSLSYHRIKIHHFYTKTSVSIIVH